MDLRAFTPGDDEALAEGLLKLQHAAYAREAALIGDDRIPPLHENVEDLRRTPLRWLGVFTDGYLIGAVAWMEDSVEVDLHRLIVDPSTARRGIGLALVLAVIGRAGNRRTVVSTGRANIPARSLYERLGFPGLWVTRYLRHRSGEPGGR